MKALKCALAISLALNLVLAVTFWRNAGTNRDEEPAVTAAAEEAVPEDVVNQKSWSDMHAPRPIISLGIEKASLRPHRERMDEGLPLPASPYAVPSWDERMRGQKAMTNKGLYIVPQTHDDNKE